MKLKWVTFVCLALVAIAIRLPAQQSDADRKLFEDTRAKAESGDASSQCLLGEYYANGNGVAKDAVEAVKWFRKAANQGDAIAQSELGLCYAAGRGVTQDYTEAVKWSRKAANQGNALAQFVIGLSYADGHGVPQDYTEAVKWYRKAADRGQTSAQYQLSNCYVEGKGVAKDFVEAYKWILLVAEQGDVAARRAAAKDLVDSFEKMLTREQIAEGKKLAREFKPHKESSSDNSDSPENPTFTGTGFFITDDGYLISNYHVVKDAAKVRLLTGAGLIDATVVKVDAANDLALLKAAGQFAPLPIAASRTVKLGGTVATVGFPATGMQGFSPKLAKGEIASLAGASDDPRYFQISVPVQHGNSGGALVDVRGNVVGIVAARLGVEIGKAVTSDELPENVNYAVKSSLLLSFLESVPDVASKIKEPNTKDEPFEDVVKSAQDAAVLVLVY